MLAAVIRRKGGSLPLPFPFPFSLRRPLLLSSTPTPSSVPHDVDVLYEDKHLVVVNKPPGVLSQGAAAPAQANNSRNSSSDTSIDMLSLVRAYVAAGRAAALDPAAGGKKKTKKPTTKPVYLGLVHRLDRNVSGAMAFAKRSKAAARLGAAFRARDVRKVYVAVVLGEVTTAPGRTTLCHALAFDSGGGVGGSRENRGNVTRVIGDAAAVASPVSSSSSSSSGGGPPPKNVGTLHYTPLLVFPHPHRRGEKETLLQVELVSGKKHQIRAQLSHVGHPIVGDVKYGAPAALRDRSIALHCRLLAFAHPKRGGEEKEEEGEQGGGKGKVVTCHAPVPPAWRARFGEAVVAAVEGVR